MTVSDLSANMTAAEFQEWQAYAAINPFGEIREDIRTGIIGSVIANGFEAIFASQFKNYKAKAHPISDFMPKFQETISTEDQSRLQSLAWAGRSAVSQELERRRLAKANA